MADWKNPPRLFIPGPVKVDDDVLQQLARPTLGHRGKEYSAVHEEAAANVVKLMGLSDDYAPLFLQGGATGQFAMVPLNLLGEGQVADYTNTGSWAAKAIKEAQVVGRVHLAADTSKEKPARMPTEQDQDSERHRCRRRGGEHQMGGGFDEYPTGCCSARVPGESLECVSARSAGRARDRGGHRCCDRRGRRCDRGLLVRLRWIGAHPRHHLDANRQHRSACS